MWSGPRMTCVMPSQKSSSGEAKLYVGRPSERIRTRSSSSTFGNLHVAEDSVVECGHAFVGHPEADRPVVHVRGALRYESLPDSPGLAPCDRAGTSTSPSQSRPSQRSDSWICSVASYTSRAVSVFSIRSRNSPPAWRAKSQLKSAVRTFPMCRRPVGEGAMRTRTDTRVAYRRAFRRPRLRGRRYLEGDRPDRGDRRQCGAGVHAEPADVEADPARTGGARALPDAQASGAGEARLLPRPLPREPRQP